MKKLFSGAIIGFLLATSVTVFAANSNTRLIINGVDITDTMDVKPQIVDGRVMVPARYVAENLAASVDWDSENSAIIIKSNDVTGTLMENTVPTSSNDSEFVRLSELINDYGFEANYTYTKEGVTVSLTYRDITGKIYEGSANFSAFDSTFVTKEYLKGTFDFDFSTPLNK